MPGGNKPQHDFLLNGLIVASYGRRYLVELLDSTVLDCVTRGKRSDLACGDRVSVARPATGQGVIEAPAPRTTLLYRSDAHREKLIAANVTQIAIVVAPSPGFLDDLLNRCLVAAEHGGMAALIALNKADLPGCAAGLESLEIYRELGYRVLALSAKRDVQPLVPQLAGQVTVLVGQSGTGKSTIINRLLPHAAARTDDLSRALNSGRHATTNARLYHLDAASHIIDSPGMQEFGLHHLTVDEVAHAFVEFRPWLGHCRFRDCQHLSEPDCAVASACAENKISKRRLASYRRLARELSKARKY